MNDFATTHRRWGYKRAWARAKSEGVVVGRDTFRRLWRAEGLRVRPRKAPKPRTAPRLQRLVKASAPGQVWAIDFQFDSDWKGMPLRSVTSSMSSRASTWLSASSGVWEPPT